jgi:DNA polymerase III subunit delta'
VLETASSNASLSWLWTRLSPLAGPGLDAEPEELRRPSLGVKKDARNLKHQRALGPKGAYRRDRHDAFVSATSWTGSHGVWKASKSSFHVAEKMRGRGAMPLSDVLGQDHALRVLRRAISTEKLHHGWLLTGPSGVGKTLLARELGQTLLCETPATGPDACGQCKACRTFESGNHPDAIFIGREEGKTRIAVSQIRQVRALLDYPPNGTQGRVVIFEKAEEMTAEAQNALLKTLEEPGTRTYLLLTTSQPSQLLPTVISRCSRLELSPLSDETLRALLRRESPELDETTASLAASLSSGSVTTALALAEQKLDELTTRVFDIDDAIARRSVPDLLRKAEEISRDKPRLGTTLELLALWYRDVLRVAAVDVEDRAFSHKLDLLRERADELGIEGASARIEASLEALKAITTRNANSRLTVEAMLLRMLK